MSRNKPIIRNVLADRYASDAMKSIWSGEGRVIIERDYWIAVMKAQRELGLKIPLKAIKAYESVKDTVNLASIDRREPQSSARCESPDRGVLSFGWL